jgi:hypothetical protein
MRSCSTPTVAVLHGRAAPSSLPFGAMPEGRQIARITSRDCGRAVEVDPATFRDLRGARLFRALRCSKCDARDAEVSIRWEAAPDKGQRESLTGVEV